MAGFLRLLAALPNGPSTVPYPGLPWTVAGRPVEPGSITAKILVLHGGSDPFVPAADVAGFMGEMVKAKAMWQMELYGSAVHSFSNPGAGDNVASGSAYNQDAEKRSIAAMDRFFGEIFAAK